MPSQESLTRSRKKLEKEIKERKLAGEKRVEDFERDCAERAAHMQDLSDMISEMEKEEWRRRAPKALLAAANLGDVALIALRLHVAGWGDCPVYAKASSTIHELKTLVQEMERADPDANTIPGGTPPSRQTLFFEVAPTQSSAPLPVVSVGSIRGPGCSFKSLWEIFEDSHHKAMCAADAVDPYDPDGAVAAIQLYCAGSDEDGKLLSDFGIKEGDTFLMVRRPKEECVRPDLYLPDEAREKKQTTEEVLPPWEKQHDHACCSLM